jgi:hypothetical protein
MAPAAVSALLLVRLLPLLLQMHLAGVSGLRANKEADVMNAGPTIGGTKLCISAACHLLTVML